MDLRLRVRNLEKVTAIEIGGEIDLHSAPQLRAALLKSTGSGGTEGVGPEAPRVLVDLSDVSFVDSTGIGVLVGALKRAREKGGDLHFCGAQPRVKRVFEITGLLRLLPLFDSREAALEGWSAPAATEIIAGQGPVAAEAGP